MNLAWLVFSFLDKPWLPWRKHAYQSLAEFDQHLYNMIQQRRASYLERKAKGQDHADDLLTMMIAANMSEEESALTNADLRV